MTFIWLDNIGRPSMVAVLSTLGRLSEKIQDV